MTAAAKVVVVQGAEEGDATVARSIGVGVRGGSHAPLLYTWLAGLMSSERVSYTGSFRGRLGEIGNFVGRQSPSYDTVLKHLSHLRRWLRHLESAGKRAAMAEGDEGKEELKSKLCSWRKVTVGVEKKMEESAVRESTPSKEAAKTAAMK
ncbi:hypothetical protein LXL04_005328 [Taraxacum kok-saghyz]